MLEPREKNQAIVHPENQVVDKFMKYGHEGSGRISYFKLGFVFVWQYS